MQSERRTNRIGDEQRGKASGDSTPSSYLGPTRIDSNKFWIPMGALSSNFCCDRSESCCGDVKFCVMLVVFVDFLSFLRATVLENVITICFVDMILMSVIP